MHRPTDDPANKRRREGAARIIADNLRQARTRVTNELLLDQEVLRLAATRVGLEMPGAIEHDSDWMPAGIVLPGTHLPVEFVERRSVSVVQGRFTGEEFVNDHTSSASPMQEVARWRYASACNKRE